MPDRIDQLTRHLHEARERLEAEFARRRAALPIRLQGRRVVISDDLRRHHRRMRVRLGAFLARSRPMVILTAPVIYSLIVPLVILDIWVSLYQAICFPVYGIARVPRRDYIAIDRHHLAYLNALQKLNCVYCGYANGLIAWVREVAARTEQYWCPIKHARRLAAPHDRYPVFADYGDAEAFRRELENLRARLAAEDDGRSTRSGHAG